VEQLHAVVTGMVQGVGFRYFVLRCANALSLTGCVRNLPEGQVEVFAEGSHDRLEQLQSFLESGPSRSIVMNVSVAYAPATGQFTDFQIDTNS
jgi:acylphosphatase